MALTERDIERVAIEAIGIGEFVASKSLAGEPTIWQVYAKKFKFTDHDGQVVELRPRAGADQTAVSGLRAPLGTLVHRVRRSTTSEAPLQSTATDRAANTAQIESRGQTRRRNPSPLAADVPLPRVTREIKTRWVTVLQDARFVLDALRHQTVNTPRPNEFTRGTGPSLWTLQPGKLVQDYDSQGLAPGSPLDVALRDAVEDVREFLDRPAPWTSRAVAEDLTRIVPVIDLAIGQVGQLQSDFETVQEIVHQLERDYLLSLAVTLTGQGTIAHTLAEWEQGKKSDYLDIASFRLVSEGGPGRVHMRDVHEATDAGITTYLIGEGVRSHDKYPEIQYMLYSQWFTYMYALWEESYRRRLAVAHGLDEDRVPWTRFDIRNPLFGDIRNIRNDVVHKHGTVDASADNSLLTWFADEHKVEISLEQMMSLANLFPGRSCSPRPCELNPEILKISPGRWLQNLLTRSGGSLVPMG